MDTQFEDMFGNVPQDQSPVDLFDGNGIVQNDMPQQILQGQQIQPQVQPPQPQQRSTSDNLSMLVNKQFYTDQEWEQREQIYVEECNKIHVDPFNLNSSEISIAAGRIDNILSPLRIDNIYAQRLLSRYQIMLKVERELAYGIVKNGTQTANLKLTVNEVESMVTKVIVQKTSFEDNKNLIDLCHRYNDRYTFTKGIIDALQDKKDLLITYSAVLKIENTTNNFAPNVPTQNQMDRMGQ